MSDQKHGLPMTSSATPMPPVKPPKPERVESLLVITTRGNNDPEVLNQIGQLIEPIAKSLGMNHLVVGDGVEVGIHSDIKPVIERMIEEQAKTNTLLAALVSAMADEDADDGQHEPMSYMDGNPV
jgi:hypothetical protein